MKKKVIFISISSIAICAFIVLNHLTIRDAGSLNIYTTSSITSDSDNTHNKVSIDDLEYASEHYDFIMPDYTSDETVPLNNNVPCFTREEIVKNEYIIFSELDSLGRCGVANSCLGPDLLPTEKRGYIGMVKPSGWHTIKYDFIDGKYLYNRCHLIGYQLTGENANEKNLITCTREMNTGVMLEYENKVANYVKKTKNHVMYRVTPIFEDNNLVAKGVIMEGYSVEDSGAGIKFNIFVYNVQDGVIIDYSNGENYPE